MQVHAKQQGAALIVALLMLLILAIIGISGMNDSIFDLRMAGNIHNYYDSLQQTDSGIAAAMSQNGNFTGNDQSDIFASGGSNSLKDYINPTVNVTFLYEDQVNTPSASGSSTHLFKEERYIIDSDHSDSATGANTHVFQGITRIIPAMQQ